MRHANVLGSVVGLSLLFAALVAAPVAAAGGGVKITVPTSVTPDVSSAITLHLPNGVAAVEGRVLVDPSVAELIGVAPTGKGQTLAPNGTPDGFSFGVYGMKPSGKANDVRLIILPHVSGDLGLRVVIDAAANKAGQRITSLSSNLASRLNVGHGGPVFNAPSGFARSVPSLSSHGVHGLFGRRVISSDDIDISRAAWYSARESGTGCASGTVYGDANGDGCVDIVDLQALGAALGTTTSSATVAGAEAVSPAAANLSATTSISAAATTGLTFTVTSTSDNPDANAGDGVCADSTGQCTLRAALTESNWHAGTNRVEFNLPGTAPVKIQLGSAPMSNIGSSSSSVVIDGYTQPGSHVNTAQYGFNGVPGVYLRGNGNSASKFIFYVAQSGNTIRGLAFDNAYRGIFLDTPNAHDNYVVGDWFGFTASGSNGNRGHAGVALNNGANHNFIGTADVADRNVAGNQDKALYAYGTGTSYNLMQNNLLCITPGGGTSTCSTGIDYDFGPQHNLIGGSNPGELNVIGPSTLNGIEFSHGWDPTTNHNSTPPWQVSYNEAVGNWVGFKADGNYDPSYRSALSKPSADNGQALHMHDGSTYNTFDGNYAAAAYDGVTIAMPNSTGDVVKNNIIGVSPRGQAAPMARYGIYFTSNTRDHTVEGNIVRNAAGGGILLIDFNVRQVLLSKNIVSDTNGPAIFMAPDPNNPSTGADELLAPPSIGSATSGQISGTGIVGATVEVFQASKSSGQTGLPIAYVGSAIVAANGTWAMTPSGLSTGDRVTATQARSDGNTSGLSTNVNVGAAPPPPVADFVWQQQSGQLAVDFTDTSTGSPSSWSWDFGDGTSSTEQNPTKTYSTDGDYTVKLTATSGGGSDTKTETVNVAPLGVGSVVAADAFGRTQSSGWGDADTGGQYSYEGNSTNFSVANGHGSITLPKAGANRAAVLAGVSASDVDLLVRVSTDKIPTGGPYIAYGILRSTSNNAYRPKLIFNTDSTVAVQAGVVKSGSESALGSAVPVAGVTQSPGSFIWMRAEATGTNPTTIRVKAWADGQSEPANWQFVATNSYAALQGPGAVGLRGYLGSGVTNAPATISFDDLTVTITTPPPPPSGIASDEFQRTLSGSWGTADNGGTYTLQGNASNYAVDGSAGTITVAKGGVTRSAVLDSTSASDLDITFKVALDKVATGGNDFVYAVSRRIGNSEYRPRIVFNSNGTITVNATRVINGSESSLGSAVVTGLSQAPGTYVWFRAQVTGTNPTTINVKAWADGSSEPASWMFTTTDGSAALQAPGAVGLRVYTASGVSNAPVTFMFDGYDVAAP